MLSVYVRRQNGETRKIDWNPTGQHVAVREGKVRMAQITWAHQEVTFAADVAGPRAVLLETVPLVDTLVLTRVAQGREWVVFHGLVTECAGDANAVVLGAVADPDQERLYEHVFSPQGPLVPSDVPPQPVAAPEAPAGTPVGGFPGVGAAGPQESPQQAAAPVLPLGDPAARPGGLPAGWKPIMVGARKE